jgi:hypothetical protein
MTEAEWLATADPGPLLAFLRIHGQVAQRRCRLLACACVRRIWPLLADVTWRRAVEVAEEFAEGTQGIEALGDVLVGLRGGCAPRSGRVPTALDACRQAAFHPEAASRVHALYAGWNPVYDWDNVAQTAGQALRAQLAGVNADAQRAGRKGGDAMRAARPGELAAQAVLVRDLFPYPLRTLPIVEPAWLTWERGLVSRLAEAAYEERSLPDGTLNPAGLAILADALVEAGCSEGDISTHLREPGPHVRGCWAVDRLLGRN